MVARAPIIAGKTVILLQVQDTVDTALAGVKRKLNKFSASISGIGLDLFKGGIVGTLPLGLLLKNFQDFEDRILFLSTKLEATDLQFAKVTDTIRKLGRETSFTANEVADGATALAQAGFNSAELTNSLGAVLDLARGGQIDLASSSAILANTIRVFSLDTARASEVASQFIVAARKGTLNVLDLKEALKEVVGTLNVLNIDLPTSLALVTQLAQSSLRGTKAGTSLNTALLQLARNQDVLKNSLGIDTVDARGNLLPFIDILDKLLKKLEPLGNARRVAVLQRLFNIRGGRAITGLLRDLERTRDLSKDIRNAGNEARIAAKKMDSEFGGAIRFAKSALEDLSIEIGKIVSGPLTKLLRTVPPLANAFQQVIAANPELVLAIAAIPPAALAAGVGLLGLGFVLNKIGALVGVLGASFGSLASILNRAFTGPLVLGLRSINAISSSARKLDSGIAARVLGPTDPARIIAAEKRVASASSALRKAQLAGSFTLEVKAQKKLAAAMGRLRKARDAGSFLGRIGQTRLSTASLFTGSASAIRSAATGSTRVASASLAAINKVFSSAATGSLKFGSIFAKILAPKPQLFNAAGQRIKKSFFGSIFGAAGGIKSLAAAGLARTFTTLGSTLKSLSSGALKLFTSGLRLLPKLFDATVTGAFKTIVAVKNIGVGFLKLGGIAFRTLTTLSGWGNIITFLLIFGDKIEFIRKGMERLSLGISKAFGTIFGTFKDAASTFSLFGEGISSLIRGDGLIGINQISESISLLGTIIKSNLVIAFNEIKIAIAPAFDFIYHGVLSIIELFKLLGGIVGVTFSNIGGGINAITGGGAGGVLGGAIEGIKAAFSPENIKAGFVFIGAVFTELAKNINSIFEKIFSVVNATLTGINRAVAGIFGVINRVSIALTKQGFIDLSSVTGFAGELANSLTVSANKQSKIGEVIAGTFQSTPRKMDGVLGKFLEALDKIFVVNTEAQGEAAKAAAEAAKKSAQDLADAGLSVAGNIAKADPNNPFVLLGRGIFELNGNLRNLIASLTANLTPQAAAAPTNVLDSLKDLFQKAKDNLAQPTTKFLVDDLKQQNAIAQRQLFSRRAGFQALQQQSITDLLRNPRSIFDIEKRLGDRRQELKDSAAKTNLEIQSRKEQIRALLRATPQFTQADSLANIVSSVSGSIQATRLNKFGFGQAEDNPTDLLKTISTQLGPGPSTDSYLKQLVDKATPLAFTQ